MPSPASVMLAARPLVVRAGAIVASVALTWQVSLLLTRPGDKTEIGAWAVIYTALFAIATVSRLGCETLAVRVTSADPPAGRAMVRAMLSVVVVLGLPAGLLLGAVAVTRPGVDAHGGRGLLVALAVVLPVLLNLNLVAGAWLRALGWVASGALLELGGVPLVAFVALAVLSLAGPVDLGEVMVVYTVSSLLVGAGSLGLALRLMRRVRPVAPRVPGRTFVATRWRELLALMLVGLGFFLFSYFLILVFAAFGDDTSAADYRNAFTLAMLVGLLPAMQASYLAPRFATFFHDGQHERLQALVSRSSRAAGAVGAVLAAPLVIAPGWVMGAVFGDAYVAAAPSLRILSLAGLVVVALGPVYPLLTMTGLQREASAIIIGVCVLGLALMTSAYVYLGPTAATAGSVVPPIGFAVLGHAVLRRRAGVDSAVWSRAGSLAQGRDRSSVGRSRAPVEMEGTD